MVRTGLPAALVTRRPDLRQAERELAAATEDIGVATADLYPRFSLLGSPTASTRTFGDLFDAVNYDWQAGPGVRWSLFSGGRNRSVVEAANARQQQALSRYEKAVIVALNEVETELAALRNETERLTIVQRARRATAQSVKRVRESHRDGALDHLDVLIEEERLREAELGEIRVKSQLLVVWTRFHKALGGGWQ
ncbi:MAG: TolC family protein [Akkermansiaceae bacterium]|nr:TolC family protein [Akkermansiaceae bacterium]